MRNTSNLRNEMERTWLPSSGGGDRDDVVLLVSLVWDGGVDSIRFTKRSHDWRFDRIALQGVLDAVARTADRQCHLYIRDEATGARNRCYSCTAIVRVVLGPRR